ncbi:TROVE domain [Trinorchestia longiramus]|nr:TROVE domain [Trinorchestia longiramus]
MSAEDPSSPPNYISTLKKSLLTGYVNEYHHQNMPCVHLVDVLIMREKQLMSKKKPNKNKPRIMADISSLHHKFAQLTNIVANLVLDGRHDEVLQRFKETIDNNRPCWQMVLTCLAAVVKGPHTSKESATAGYKMLPQLLKNSAMLFFFLQTLKLTQPDAKTAGFGRGLKTAVRCWYYGLSPESLLLELWHRPHAYGWSHKDVLKLVHIKQDMLSLGSRVVICWFFTSLDKTKAKFSAEKDAAPYIEYLDCLHNKAHEGNLAHLRVETLKQLEQSCKCSLLRQQDKLLNDPQGLASLMDVLDSMGATVASMDPNFVKTVASPLPPTPSAEDANASAAEATDNQGSSTQPQPYNLGEVQKEACQALVRRLQQPDVVAEVPPVTLAIAANTMRRRVKSRIAARGSSKWRGGQPLVLAPSKKKELHSVTIPPHLQEPLDVYDGLIYKAAVKRSLAASFPALLFVSEPHPDYNKYIDTMPGFNVHKQLKASQAVVLSLLTLCHSDAENWSSSGVRCVDSDALFVPFDFTRPGFAKTVEDFERTCNYQMATSGQLDKILEKCSELSKQQVVFFSLWPRENHKTEVEEYFAKTPADKAVSKVVLVSLNAPLDQPCQLLPTEPRVLQLRGFHERSIDIIESFLTDQY